VIIDAVSLKPEERGSFLAVAEAAGVPFVGLWLAAPATTMDQRLRARSHDASDASPEVLAQQLRQDLGTMDWVRIDAGAGPEECLAAARLALGVAYEACSLRFQVCRIQVLQHGRLSRNCPLSRRGRRLDRLAVGTADGCRSY
jgi:hypothetical protein